MAPTTQNTPLTNNPKKNTRKISYVTSFFVRQLVKARKGLPEGYMILGQFQQSQQGLGLWRSASVTAPK